MKRCPFCGEIQQDAAVCWSCQADLVANTPANPAPVIAGPPAWNRGIAAAMSAVLPGAGQFYKGQVVYGFLWLVSVLLLYWDFVLAAIAAHLTCMLAAACGDNTGTATSESIRPSSEN